jgi:electron transfer flavoprotein alpha subunit
VSFQSASFNADLISSGSAEIREVAVELDEDMIKTTAEEPFQEEAGGVDLTAAEIIISIGRGIGKEENLPIAEALAQAIGGEISSSRPVVDSGWLPSFRQIGSSGQTVSPKLYFALGISGAIQHVVGMKGSKNIVAINKDAEAPIFELADYGVVGDLLEIVPKLTEAILAAKN